MTATRVTWGQAFWAVIGATILATIATVVVMLLVYLVGVPSPFLDGTSGQGWPWRIEGPWSFAADVGPMLFAGGVFAGFVEGFTRKHTGVATRWLPIALTAAVLGWVFVHGTENAGIVRSGGVLAFIAIVVVTREMSGRPRRPWRWTPVTAWSALILVPALAIASLSYALLHPLSADSAEVQSIERGRANISTRLANDGRADVTVLSVTVPQIRTRALTSPAESYEYDMGDPDAGMIPIAGKTIARGESRDLTLAIPARCPSSRTVDRVNVRLRVLGRTVEQVVRLAPPVPVGCA